MSHTCHARGCTRPVKPQLLMCMRHWRRVPPSIQGEVYAAYRDGQCDDKQPSREWHDAASAAIGWVATAEDQPLLRSEVRALSSRGHGQRVIDSCVRRLGEGKRSEAEKQLKLWTEGA